MKLLHWGGKYLAMDNIK